MLASKDLFPELAIKALMQNEEKKSRKLIKSGEIVNKFT